MNSHNIILTPMHSYVNHITCHDGYLSHVQVLSAFSAFALVYQYIHFESSTEVDNLDAYNVYQTLTVYIRLRLKYHLRS